ncbi:MAG: hypothetical protein R3A12_17975 [Ignavibacteria bacterium]
MNLNTDHNLSAFPINTVMTDNSTILCGVAQYLNIHNPNKGRIRLLFQSSEEIGTGAKAILDDKKYYK